MCVCVCVCVCVCLCVCVCVCARARARASFYNQEEKSTLVATLVHGWGCVDDKGG